MENPLRNLVQNRAEIKALLKDIPSSQSTGTHSWISPHERHLPQLNYDIDLEDPEKIKNLIQLHEEIFSNSKINKKKMSKVLVGFDQIAVPDSTPPRPLASDVRTRIENGILNIGVYSTEGYNFGFEYQHIYSGETLPETRYDDIIAILSRGVNAMDPTINFVTAKMFAEYIVRIACWEVEYANLITTRTIEKNFPGLQAQVYENMNFHIPFIYLGLSEQSIPYFWVRLCPPIESTNTDTGSLRDVDKGFEKHTCFCYYHRYPLTVQNCEELDVAGYADSSTGEIPANDTGKSKPTVGIIPPPPKKLIQSDIRMHLLLRNSEKTSAPTTEDEQLDISVDINNDNENAHELDEILLENEDNTFFANDQVYTPRHSQVPNDGAAQIPPGKTSAPLSSMTLTCNPTPFADLIGWGRNTAFLFDPDQDKLTKKLNRNSLSDSTTDEDAIDYISYHPVKISIPPSINLERISMIACSHRHMIVLTHNGSLYSCGDNTEGALGMGDTFTRRKLTLVLWPIEHKKNPENPSRETEDLNENTPTSTGTANLLDRHLNKGNAFKRIVYIAAGSSDIGSHSMAIDVDGALYGWGTPSATGHGKIQPVLSPSLVKIPLVDDSVLEPQENQPTLATEKVIKVKHVACGGGFTVAVLSNGQVASWGMWAHGRLGLGIPPQSQINRGAGARRRQDKKKVVRYQLKPRLIPGIGNAVKVACGEAHSLCLTASGKVYSWGQNSCGQLGIGPTPSGYLRDMLIPTRVHFLSTDQERKELYRFQTNKYPHTGVNGNKNSLQFTDIACGTFHSLATDVNSNVWSWGGRGDLCLGHGDSQLTGVWAERCKSVFPTLSTANKLMVPFDLLDWCKKWSVPRLIKSLQFQRSDDLSTNEDKVIQISGGDMHSSILFQSGRMYFCGNGPVVSPIQIKVEEEDEDEDEGDEGSESKADANAHLNEAIRELEKKLVTVSTPRCPSSLWYERLSVRKIKYIASAGTYSVVLQDEDMIVSSLTESLLHSATNNSKLLLTSDLNQQDNGTVTTDTTPASASLSTTGQYHLPSIGRGKADCILIAAGKILVAHRGLLANRCAVLREKLIEEAPVDDGATGSLFTPTQVLLSDLTHDPAKALHMYLYTDCLPPLCVKNLSTLQSLLRIAKKLRIPRLIAICESFISIHRQLTNSLFEEDNEDILDYDENERGGASQIFSNLTLDIPPSTVARDLGSLVGDSQYADIRFIAEGRSIAAHRFILEARCEYFRLMFSSGMAESNAVNEESAPAMVDIVVPDSFVGLLRFLIYLYTDILPDGSDGALLEDLMSADRYQVPGLKRLCESMLVPSQSNWLDLLRAAHLFNCPQLEVSVMSYLRDHVGDLLQVGETQNLSEEFPTLLDDVMELRRIAFPSPPNQLLIDHNSFVKRKVEEKRRTIHLPWWSLVMAILLSLVYREVVTVISLGPLVPVINILGLCGLVYYFYTAVLQD